MFWFCFKLLPPLRQGDNPYFVQIVFLSLTVAFSSYTIRSDNVLASLLNVAIFSANLSLLIMSLSPSRFLKFSNNCCQIAIFAYLSICNITHLFQKEKTRRQSNVICFNFDFLFSFSSIFTHFTLFKLLAIILVHRIL